jgi:Domain of unknown function (DUF4190)/Septum formation
MTSVPPSGYDPPPQGPDQPAVQPQYQPPYQPLNQSQVPPGTNGFAIASLIFGIIPMCAGLLAVIFGIVGLNQVRRTGQKGKGLAIAGLVLGGLWIAAIAVGVVVSALSEADRDSEGNITREGSASVNSLKVGDCIKTLTESSAVFSVPLVPCSNPHQAEVIGEFTLANGDCPGEQAIEQQALDKCETQLKTYAKPAAVEEVTELYYLYPRKTDWSKGDRKVVCLALHDASRTGSLRG